MDTAFVVKVSRSDFDDCAIVFYFFSCERFYGFCIPPRRNTYMMANEGMG
jgi:hypothetical protein